MKKFVFLLYFIILSTSIIAQQEASHWLISGNLLKFSPQITVTPPIISPLPLSITQLSWGSSTIADKNGNLLFYSDGLNIYNAQHQIIENGSGLQTCAARTNCYMQQPIIIVPNPASIHLYYLFQNDATNGLFYSMIDMSQNNGKGKVIQKNIRLRDRVGYSMAATIGADCQSYWLFTHDWVKSGCYYSYKITTNGIQAAIESSLPNLGNTMDSNMYINFSTQGNRVSTIENMSLLNSSTIFSIPVLYDFDQQTGKLSNKIYLLDSLPANSGVKIRWVVRGGNLSLTAKTDSIHVNWGSTNTNAEVVAIVQAVTGCVDSFKLAVKILPELRPTLPTGSTKICWTADNLQTYTTNFTNGSVYEWHVEGGTLQSPQGKNSIAVRWNGVGQHRIWVTENSTTRTDICRGTSEKLTVNVLPTPLPKTIVGLTEICENEVQTTYRYDSETTSTYVWTVQGGEIVAGQGTQEIVVSWKNATQNALVKVQETNASGCKGQVQEQTIRINSTENCLVIPSLVSVGDAHFPYWHIKNIEKYPNNGLVVYNSLGQIVIQQNGYQNNYPLTHLSAGMYYYRLWVQSGERKISYAGKLVVVK